MNDIHSDEEQVQALKRWWEENGTSLMLTLAVGLAALAGWNWWQGSQQNKLEQSFADYQQIVSKLEVLQQNPADEVTIAELDFQAQQIKESYPSSYYASFAAFLKAKNAMADEDYAAAREELNWVLEQNPSTEIRLIATLRLARVEFQMGETDKALQLLAQDDKGSFEAAYAELEGDILVSAERYQEAYEAYEVAFAAVNAGEAASPLIQSKIGYAGSFL